MTATIAAMNSTRLTSGLPPLTRRYACDTYQRALHKIAATTAKHSIAAGMYFISSEIDPNFFVQKGFKFFTMPWCPWAPAGIQNALADITR